LPEKERTHLISLEGDLTCAVGTRGSVGSYPCLPVTADWPASGQCDRRMVLVDTEEGASREHDRLRVSLELIVSAGFPGYKEYADAQREAPTARPEAS
jgi:hypothetical protein